MSGFDMLLAGAPATPAHILAALALATVTDPRIAGALAGNPNTPVHALRALLTGPHPIARSAAAAAASNRCDEELAAAFAHCTDIDLWWHALRPRHDPTPLLRLARSLVGPSTVLDDLTLAAPGSPRDQAQAAGDALLNAGCNVSDDALTAWQRLALTDTTLTAEQRADAARKLLADDADLGCQAAHIASHDLPALAALADPTTPPEQTLHLVHTWQAQHPRWVQHPDDVWMAALSLPAIPHTLLADAALTYAQGPRPAQLLLTSRVSEPLRLRAAQVLQAHLGERGTRTVRGDVSTALSALASAHPAALTSWCSTSNFLLYPPTLELTAADLSALCDVVDHHTGYTHRASYAEHLATHPAQSAQARATQHDVFNELVRQGYKLPAPHLGALRTAIDHATQLHGAARSHAAGAVPVPALIAHAHVAGAAWLTQTYLEHAAPAPALAGTALMAMAPTWSGTLAQLWEAACTLAA